MSASSQITPVGFELDTTSSQQFSETPIHPTKCPGLFYRTPALDGNIIRIRTPGGIVNTKQLIALSELARCFGDGNLYLTNRANLQIRGVQEIPATALTSLQQLGLAAIPEVDHIRNIMTSPTAGIDVEELIDTLPLVQELDSYICLHPELAGLSAKFSVGFDGGGRVAIFQQPNDIKFVAVRDIDGEIYLRLFLGNWTDVAVKPEECLSVVVALIQVYLQQVDISASPKLRFLELVKHLGITKYLELAQGRLPFVFKKQNFHFHPRENHYFHLDAHPQKQQNLSYIGITVPLGKISVSQVEILSKLADMYGSGKLRLTPWQNILIPDIQNQNILQVQAEILSCGLKTSANSPEAGIVACTGNHGCQAGITDTKSMAATLIRYFKNQIYLDIPCKIHLTSCPKSCAHHGKSDITLLGTVIENDECRSEGYDVYVGDRDSNFGREIYQGIPSPKIVALVLKMLQTYQAERQHPQETFADFTNRYEIDQLQQLFNIQNSLPSLVQEVNC